MTTWRGQIAPHYSWLVIPVIDGGLPSKQLVTDALRSLAVPVCPHPRFCDPFITDLYFTFADQGWVFRKCCQHCRTSVYFDIHVRLFAQEDSISWSEGKDWNSKVAQTLLGSPSCTIHPSFRLSSRCGRRLLVEVVTSSCWKAGQSPLAVLIMRVTIRVK